MNFESTPEVGGYFELDLPNYGDPFPAPFMKFQSGRAALRAALEHSNFKKIILPAYICDSVIHAVVDSGKKPELYHLDDHLCPKNIPDPLPEDCALLYVNYFGICQENIIHLSHSIPPQQLIIDNTQALFQSPSKVLACIYSPRKFVGIPDGGLLVAPGLQIEVPELEDTDSVERTRHLLLRMAYTAEDGYLAYTASDDSLRNTKPLRMSRLTNRILASIDMNLVREKRRENFMALADIFDRYNLCRWNLHSDSVPLCYILMLRANTEILKKSLARKGIYIPTYWQDATHRIEPNGIEHRLINYSLAVPCDQRYTPAQLVDTARQIISAIENF